MARALIVACGCRGRELGGRLIDAGWQVRGTTREPGNSPDIERRGIDPAVADPDRAASILDHVSDVTLVFWLLGSAVAEPGVIGAIHGPRLERVLERLVDTPVRGFVYEGAGRVESQYLERGAAAVRAASERWRIPAAMVDEDPSDWRAWTDAMVAVAGRLVDQPVG